MMLRYFWYHFKETLLRLGILIMFVCVCSFNLVSGYLFKYVDFSVMQGLSFGAALLIPVLEFRKFNIRRNLDTWFSLPIDRWKLALVHYINGAIHVTAVVLTAFSFVATALSEVKCTDWGGAFTYFMLMELATMLLYGFFCFAFTQANNTADGCMFIMDYAMLPMVLNIWLLEDKELRSLYSLMQEITGHYRSILIPGGEDFYGYRYEMEGWNATSILGPFALNAVICVAATVLLFVFFQRRRTEKVDGISDSWFGFRTLIPIMAVATLGESIILDLVLFRIIMIVVAYMIYRKGKRFQPSDLVVIGTYSIVLILTGGL